LAYQTDRKYDAIVIMGVIEHLPQYDRVLAKFVSLLKPGGNIYLDGSACTRKYELSAFMVKYIYPGNHSFRVGHDFLDNLARTPLRVLEIFNDATAIFSPFSSGRITSMLTVSSSLSALGNSPTGLSSVSVGCSI
jgi:cyclopropane-fatty-acyl-phospholipid synthase